MAKEENAENKEVLLSPEEVFDVVQFAKMLVRGVGIFPGAITPQLLSEAMKNISYSPQELSETDLTDALKNPKDSEMELRRFMEYLEIVSMPIKRIISYEASHLAFDLTYTVRGELEDKDFLSKQYKRDKAMMYEFLDKLDWHGQFRNALRQLLRNEMYIFSTRDDGERIVLQELPIDRCRITGKHDYGFLISFDFNYFLQAGVDIRFYPTWFKEKYAKLYSNGASKNGYVPSLNPAGRGAPSGHFANWIDVPPDVAWVFKLDPSIVTAVPYAGRRGICSRLSLYRGHRSSHRAAYRPDLLWRTLAAQHPGQSSPAPAAKTRNVEPSVSLAKAPPTPHLCTAKLGAIIGLGTSSFAENPAPNLHLETRRSTCVWSLHSCWPQSCLPAPA